jgi:hypothetical protein
MVGTEIVILAPGEASAVHLNITATVAPIVMSVSSKKSVQGNPCCDCSRKNIRSELSTLKEERGETMTGASYISARPKQFEPNESGIFVYWLPLETLPEPVTNGNIKETLLKEAAGFIDP